ncbi:MAG: GAF domain-containing protein [Phyllobacteriaceae bacterium]|nr:GAF domain-containing protein [Phyllobacteriaceae bacterium]
MDLPESLVDRLVAISQALAGQTEPGEAFRATAAEVSQLIPYDHIDIAVMSEEDGNMHLVYEVGPKTSWSSSVTKPFPTDSSPARLVLREIEPYLLTDDAVSDQRFHFEGALDGPIYAAQLRSRIIVPMKIRGNIVGSLNISRQVPGCYNEDDVKLAQICADLLTPYIMALIQSQAARRATLAERRSRRRERQLRIGASRLTQDMDKQSRRLAMDLHDQTLGDLARISRHVATMKVAHPSLQNDFDELEQMVTGCLTELRGIVDDMQPSVLQFFGLRDALEAHALKAFQYTVPKVDVRIIDLTGGAVDDLKDPERTVLYRIAQEAINNCSKHSGAREVEIIFSTFGENLRITVGDDGRGLGAGVSLEQGGMSNMHTRAALIGARLRIESGLPQASGTRVILDYRLKETPIHPPAIPNRRLA